MLGAHFGARLLARKTPAPRLFCSTLARLAKGPPRQQRFDTLRMSIREIGATRHTPIGRCQLAHIWENRTRSSVVMPLE